MSEWQGYGATGEPGTCLWCGRKLRQPKRPFTDDGQWIPRGQRTATTYSKPGDYGDGNFCGLRCGYMFGVRLADAGTRLVRKVQP